MLFFYLIHKHLFYAFISNASVNFKPKHEARRGAHVCNRHLMGHGYILPE